MDNDELFNLATKLINTKSDNEVAAANLAKIRLRAANIATVLTVVIAGAALTYAVTNRTN